MRTVVFGPPGTGKTTYLVNQVKESGLSPEEVGYFSFTRKAAEEAGRRIGGRYPYFSTLHAFCFRQLDIGVSNLLSDNEILQALIKLKVPVEKRETVKKVIMSLPFGKEVTYYWPRASVEDILICNQVRSYLNEYKEVTGKIEFHDMLTRWLDVCQPIPFKLLIIDEAQDLNDFQWEIAFRLESVAENSFFAGDDDQAIYAWNGADAKKFMSLEGRKIVLSQSFRLPRSVHNLASSISFQIANRVHKSFEPMNYEGQVSIINHITEAPITNGQPWWILCRDNKEVLKIEAILSSQGIICNILTGRFKGSIHRKGIKVTEIIDRLYFNSISAKEYRLLMKLTNLLQAKEELFKGNPITAKVACPDIARTELIKACVSPETFQAFQNAAEHGNKINNNITVATIHQVKGGECENVILNLSFPKRSQINEGDEEHRVWYVGATRAKKYLYLLKGDRSYEIHNKN